MATTATLCTLVTLSAVLVGRPARETPSASSSEVGSARAATLKSAPGSPKFERTLDILVELLGNFLHWTWLLPLPPGNEQHVHDDDDIAVEVERQVVVGKVVRAVLLDVCAVWWEGPPKGPLVPS